MHEFRGQPDRGSPKKRPWRPASVGGQSLLEVAMALVIIGTALIPTTSVWSQASVNDRQVVMLSQAFVLADRLWEAQVRSTPFAQQTATSGTDPSTGLGYSFTVASTTPTLHTITLTITPPSSGPLVLSLAGTSAMGGQ